jgi:hypothetical protein
MAALDALRGFARRIYHDLVAGPVEPDCGDGHPIGLGSTVFSFDRRLSVRD